VSVISVIYAERRIQALYAEWHYAECRYAECHGAFPGLQKFFQVLQHLVEWHLSETQKTQNLVKVHSKE